MTKVSGTQIAWTVAGGGAAVLTALLLGGSYLWWQQGQEGQSQEGQGTRVTGTLTDRAAEAVGTETRAANGGNGSAGASDGTAADEGLWDLIGSNAGHGGRNGEDRPRVDRFIPQVEVDGAAAENVADSVPEPAQEPAPEADSKSGPEVAALTPETELPPETDSGATDIDATDREPDIASEQPAEVDGTVENAEDPAVNQTAEAGGASADAPAAPALSAPVLDVVRVESDGFALVAGSAQVGSDVSVLLDGQELARQSVDSSGSFVTFLPVPTSSQPQVLALKSEYDGQVAYSEASFILAPVAAVAAAESPQPVAEGTQEAGARPDVEEAVAGLTGLAGAAAEPGFSETEFSGAGVPEAGVSGPDVSEARTGESQLAALPAEAPVEADPVLDIAASTQSAPQPDPQTNIPTEPQSAAQTAAQATTQTIAQTGAQTLDTDLAAATEEDRAAQQSGALVAADRPVSAADPAAPEVASADPGLATEPKPAPNPVASVAVLKADSSGIRLIQPAAPVAPELAREVVLDTISYSPAGAVLLAGRARPQALVRVYLDNAPVAEISSAGDGSWAAELEDVAPGIYTLRLDELAGNGARVLSRIETPFKREAPEVLAPIVGAEAGSDVPRIQAITVQQGDTLWAISNAAYGEGLMYVRVFEANKEQIRNPDLIYPGQIFNLPE